MRATTKSYLAILMGITIVANLWWTWTSYTYLPWLAAAVIIFVASVEWIYLDYDLMKSKHDLRFFGLFGERAIFTTAATFTLSHPILELILSVCALSIIDLSC